MRITSFLLALSAMLCTIAIEPRAAQISCKEEWGHAASVGWAKTGFPENIGIPGPTEAHCFSIRIEGEIASGDYNAFRLMLKRHDEPYAHTVFLISPGGDVKEAI